MSNIDQTLAERGARYGDFPGHAAITQGMKDVMQGHAGWNALADDQKEALEMVAHKIGRILNGDPNYIDSWTDIIGYTRLVEKRLIDEQKVQQDIKVDAARRTYATDHKVDAARCAYATDLKFDPKKSSADVSEDFFAALRKALGPDVEVHRL